MIALLYLSFMISLVITTNKELTTVTGFITPSKVLNHSTMRTLELENIHQHTVLSWVGQSEEKEIPKKAEDVEVQSSESNAENCQTLRANRFSKFAPDAELPPDEFRRQLKENMKADLERRRRNDSTRGNQPAKNYLDNL